jgi:hypothetical protein
LRVSFLFESISYEYTVGSDVERNGMFLEVAPSPDQEVVLEIFYSDQAHTMTFTAFRADIPLPVIDWAITEAKDRPGPISSR